MIESLSLGAGNTGRHHDLETDRQIAEFKFIRWRGGAEAIRQNNVFIDIFNLASANKKKRRVLYLLDKHHALRFLGPKRIIAAFAPKSAIRATSSVTPASIAMSTTISDALTEYSHQRAGLIPRATFASYQRRGRPPLSVTLPRLAAP